MSHTVGIDLGGTRFKIGILSGSKELAFGIYPSFKEENMPYNMGLVKDYILDLCQDNQIDKGQIQNIGLAFPGLVDIDNSRVLSSRGKYVDAPQFNFKDWAQKNFNAPIAIDNDSRMACWGEHIFGVSKNYHSSVMVTFGTGIGTGVISNDQLFIGRHYQGGCLGGHIPVNAGGRPCYCGNTGCLEAESSLPALEKYAQGLDGYADSILSKQPSFDFEQLFNWFREGDTVAVKTLNYCLELWSTGIISYIHAYDPEVIVLGGGILKSKDIILPYFRDYVGRHAWTPWGQVNIEASVLNDRAGYLGAAHIAENNT